MTPRKTPPMLPTRRARLHATRTAVRAALLAARPGRGHVLPRTVDTSLIDAAWPAVATPVLGALETLAALVRSRKTGRAFPEHEAARAAVVALLTRIGVRRVRLADVTFQLGEAHGVWAGEGTYTVRAGALRVKVEKPVRVPRVAPRGAHLGRVREAVVAAASAGADVINLAERRARRSA